MSIKKKVIASLATTMLLSPIAIGTVSKFTDVLVSAAQLTEKAKITLHKVEDNETVNEQNTGDKMAYFENNRPIAGVKFKIYDITDIFVKVKKGEFVMEGTLMVAPQTGQVLAEAAYKALSAATEIAVTPDSSVLTAARFVGEGTTDNEGEVSWEVNQGTTGANKAYLIVETDASGATVAQTNDQGLDVVGDDGKVLRKPITVTSSRNTLITLPIIKGTDADGNLDINTADNEIDLYPKNKTGNITKTLVGDGTTEDDLLANDGKTRVTADDRYIGEEAKFIIQTPMPYDLATTLSGKDASDTEITKYKHESWALTDTPDKELSFKDLEKVEVAGADSTEIQWTEPGKEGYLIWKVGSNNYRLPFRHKHESVNVNKDHQDVETWTITPGAVSSAKTTVGGVEYVDTTSALRYLSGKTITWYVTTIVNASATPDIAFNNEATSTDSNNNVKTDGKFADVPTETKDTDDSEFLVTFGRKFIKLDGNTLQPLSNAEFVVTRKASDGNTTLYYVDYNDHDGVVWDTDIAKAKKYTASTADATKGRFEVKGLSKGTYEIVETKAPNSSYIINKPQSFEVGKGTYTASDIDGEKVTDNEAQDLLNYSQGFLPSTGGLGITAFIIVGVSSTIFAGVKLTRAKRLDDQEV